MHPCHNSLHPGNRLQFHFFLLVAVVCVATCPATAQAQGTGGRMIGTQPSPYIQHQSLEQLEHTRQQLQQIKQSSTQRLQALLDTLEAAEAAVTSAARSIDNTKLLVRSLEQRRASFLANTLRDECALGIDTCHPNADCTDTDSSFVCTCKQGYVGDGIACSPATSCRDVLTAVSGAPSGLYNLTLPGDGSLTQVYCDMTTDGGPWMLVSKFSQKGGHVSQLSQSDYDAYFKNTVWIKGAAPGTPVSPNLTVQANGIYVESHDWRKALGSAGSTHRLRQRVHNTEQGREFDVSFEFNYTGVVTQNDASSDSQKKWDLSDRRVIKDTYLLGWSEHMTGMYMWLPFTTGYSGSIYCDGQFGTNPCGVSQTSKRRYGNAGFVLAGKAPAFKWGPATNTEISTFDIVWTLGDSSIVSQTGDDIVLTYWLT